MRTVDIRDRYSIEQDVRRYPEVISCKVLVGPTGELDSVNVLLREATDELSFANHLDELLASSYGITAGKDKLRVSRLGGRRRPGQSDKQRPKISNIVFMADSVKGEAQVMLEHDSGEGVGRSTGQLTYQQRLRLISEATLLAVEDITGKKHQFSLESISEITMLDQQVIVVLVHCFDPLNKVLSGSCPVLSETGSIDHAVVRATLSAINRTVGRTLYPDA